MSIHILAYKWSFISLTMEGIKLYCSNCGVKISEDAEICRKCGVRPFRTKDFCYCCGEKNYNKYQSECISCGADLDNKTVSASNMVDMNDSWFAAIQTALPDGFKQFIVKLRRE
jgi:hypothetical protein